MADGNSSKKKFYYLRKILLEKTDENHPLSAARLIEELARYDIPAERKSIYKDIEALNDFDMDIVQTGGKNGGYYVASREFELPEVKLLVDAVQSSKFITTRKSETLISKLKHLTSESQASLLQRSVFIYNRTKAENETIFYSVDAIHGALSANRQIRFRYCVWTETRELRPKNNGMIYEISPWALSWDDENYYMVGYDANRDEIRHYRVDKMQNVEISEKARSGKEKFADFDLAEFSKKTFGMYGGTDETVTLRCRNTYAGVMIDRYGKDVTLIPAGKDHFKIRIPVAVSPQFFGWLAGLGADVKIASPTRVKETYRDYLNQILDSM